MFISKFVPVGVCGKHREPAFVGYSLVSLPFIAHDIHTQIPQPFTKYSCGICYLVQPSYSRFPTHHAPFYASFFPFLLSFHNDKVCSRLYLVGVFPVCLLKNLVIVAKSGK